MRLHKFIANCGYTSRRHAELLIQAGRVEVNGRLVTSLGNTVRPGKDVVAINGEAIQLPEALSIMFNKPAGLITSTHDTHERLTVMDCLPRSLTDKGLLPAGRLDQDTEGLLVITNVGDLNHRITHPRYETEKEYAVTVERKPDDSALKRLERGIAIDGVTTSPARIAALETTELGVRINIVIHEGRKRQVKRMFAAVGCEVLHLGRIRIGQLTLDGLPLGKWRRLSEKDIEALIQGER